MDENCYADIYWDGQFMGQLLIDSIECQSIDDGGKTIIEGSFNKDKIATEIFKTQYLCEWDTSNGYFDTTNYIYYPYEVLNKAFDDFNKAEETEEMCENDFQLGDVKEVKDEIYNITDGEAILLAPGFTIDKFKVIQTDNAIRILVIKDEGTDEFQYDLNTDYKIDKVGYNVKDGVFKLKVDYKVESNVEVDTTL